MYTLYMYTPTYIMILNSQQTNLEKCCKQDHEPQIQLILCTRVTSIIMSGI